MTTNKDFHIMPDDLKMYDTLYIVTGGGIVYKCIVTGWEMRTYVGGPYWSSCTSPAKQKDTKTYYLLSHDKRCINISAGQTGYYVMRNKEEMKDLLKAMIMQ